MAIYVSTPRITEGVLKVNAEETTQVVFSAVIAGVILYFINKSFLNNFPAYVSIILGVLLTIYLAGHPALYGLGFALIADGFYKLIKEYVVINS
jgi:hypothetical protein